MNDSNAHNDVDVVNTAHNDTDADDDDDDDGGLVPFVLITKQCCCCFVYSRQKPCKTNYFKLMILVMIWPTGFLCILEQKDTTNAYKLHIQRISIYMHNMLVVGWWNCWLLFR